MGALSLSHLAPAFAIGLLATLNPCVLPLYPGYLAYLSKTSSAGDRSVSVRHLGFLVLAGVVAMTLILGAMIAGLSQTLQERTSLSLQALGILLMILMGVLLLFDINPFARLLQVRLPAATGPYTGAFVYGFLFGPMIMPCAGPLVIGIFSLSIGILGFMEHLLFFVIFSLGFGLPLLALSFLPKDFSGQMLGWFARRARFFNRLSGSALTAIGIWNLAISFELLRLMF